jgi:hypothetical protein
VFRPKDLQGWWSHQHFNRPGGVRAATPTAWVPKSKPLRLVEFGCGAVDKGANAPNLFVDQKSAESALPPFSDGARDEVGQRRALEAVLAHLADPAANPVSPVYGGPMIEAASAWCWDARPFPDFPARGGVWADGPNWTLGHWLNGRAGIAPLPELIAALAQRAGVAVDPGRGRRFDRRLCDRPAHAAARRPGAAARGLRPGSGRAPGRRGAGRPFGRGGHRPGRRRPGLARGSRGAGRRRADPDRPGPDPAPALHRRRPRLPDRRGDRPPRRRRGRRRSRRAAGAGRRRGPRRGRAAAGGRRSAPDRPSISRPWPPCAWSPATGSACPVRSGTARPGG